MDQENLRSLLERLRSELAVNPPTDDRGRRLLQELQQDIERAIAPGSQATDAAVPRLEPHNLRERIQQAIASFEGSHPQSVGALERAMTLLSNFGL